MFGSGYVIDHVIAEYKTKADWYAYRVYVTDMLKCLAETWGADVPSRYREMIEPQDEPESGDEVALRVIKRLGLKVKTNGLYETESEPIA